MVKTLPPRLERKSRAKWPGQLREKLFLNGTNLFLKEFILVEQTFQAQGLVIKYINQTFHESHDPIINTYL